MGYNYDTIEDLLNEPFKVIADTSKDIILAASNTSLWSGWPFNNTPNYFYMNGEQITQLAYSPQTGKVCYYIPGMNNIHSKPGVDSNGWTNNDMFTLLYLY